MIILNIFCCISRLCGGLLLWTINVLRVFQFCCGTRLRRRFIIAMMCIYAVSADRQPLFAQETTESTAPKFSIQAADYANESMRCQKQHASFVREPNITYCEATFDQILCWPPTSAGTNVTQNCPEHIDLMDPNDTALTQSYKCVTKGRVQTELNAHDDVPVPVLSQEMSCEATRYCGPDGRWLDRNLKNLSDGWTNYITCFTVELQDLLVVVTTSDPNDKFAVAGRVRAVELFCLICSALGLLVGIIIFTTFRTLKNKRTSLHVHLFSNLLCQCSFTLFIYIDQEAYNILGKMVIGCKLIYIGYEYFQTNGFFFMFLEGFNMFRTVTDNMTLLQISYRKMITFGYACPIINIVVWVITAALRYEQTANKRCWFGYNLDKIYWILQGPRLGVIIHNLFFMSGIVRVLMLKLKDNKESDATRTWKGCRATVILMPLLGTTNFLSMTAAPIKSGTVEFASWAFCAYLLRSLQGFIVAVLYCFTNAEVKEVLKHRIEAWRGRNAQNHSVRFRAHTSELECEVFSRDVEQTRWATQQPESPTLAHQRSETHSVDIEMVTLELKADNGNLKTPTHEKKSEISLENGHLKSPTQKESSGNSSDDGHLASHEDCKIAVEDESVDIPIEEKDCEIILTSEILKLPEDIKET